jgi:hypothetical protein
MERVAMELIDRGAAAIVVHEPSGRSVLWWASRHGFLTLAKALVDGGADVNRCENGRFGWDSPATIAAGNGHAANVTLLLNSGADASYRSAQSGNTAGEMVRRLSQAQLEKAQTAVRELTVLQEEGDDGAAPLTGEMAQWFTVDGIALGDVVMHPKRGRGTVVHLEEPGVGGGDADVGQEARVHIKFDALEHGMVSPSRKYHQRKRKICTVSRKRAHTAACSTVLHIYYDKSTPLLRHLMYNRIFVIYSSYAAPLPQIVVAAEDPNSLGRRYWEWGQVTQPRQCAR